MKEGKKGNWEKDLIKTRKGRGDQETNFHDPFRKGMQRRAEAPLLSEAGKREEAQRKTSFSHEKTKGEERGGGSPPSTSREGKIGRRRTT